MPGQRDDFVFFRRFCRLLAMGRRHNGCEGGPNAPTWLFFAIHTVF
jgi:hypothetical protein